MEEEEKEVDCKKNHRERGPSTAIDPKYYADIMRLAEEDKHMLAKTKDESKTNK